MNASLSWLVCYNSCPLIHRLMRHPSDLIAEVVAGRDVPVASVLVQEGQHFRVRQRRPAKHYSPHMKRRGHSQKCQPYGGAGTMGMSPWDIHQRLNQLDSPSTRFRVVSEKDTEAHRERPGPSIKPQHPTLSCLYPWLMINGPRTCTTPCWSSVPCAPSRTCGRPRRSTAHDYRAWKGQSDPWPERQSQQANHKESQAGEWGVKASLRDSRGGRQGKSLVLFYGVHTQFTKSV